MFRLAAIIFGVTAPVLMGSFILIILIVPDLLKYEAQLMLPAAGAGIILAIPASYFIAKKLTNLTGSK